MDIIVTAAGRQALINAAQTGMAPVVINRIGVGTGKYTPSATQTTLVAETKRLPIVEGGNAGDNSIHVAYRDSSTDSYSIHEIGLFLSDGTLFAVTSQTNPILQKTGTSTAFLVIDIAFTDVDITNLTFGNVTFSNPAANQENAGVVTIATNDEVIAGTNTQKVVTPASLVSRTATATRIGLVELATSAEGTNGTDTARAMTPAATKATIDARAATSTDALAGTSTTLFVTPASLKTVTATSSRIGLVELATDDEAKTGTDTARAVTPASLKAVIDARTLAASETQAGVVALATNAEVIAGTDTQKAVTSAGLASRTASATQAGLVELATSTEGTTGTDTVRAMTPAATKATIDARAATSNDTITGTSTSLFVTPAGLKSLTSTTARAGLVELATDDEAKAGTDTARAVTSSGLKAAITAATPVASDSVAGLVELATSDEVTTGTSTTHAVTPAGLSARTASANVAGLVKLATASQGTAGTSASVAMTPYSSKALVDSYAASADDTVAGTSTAKFVTPAALVSRTATDGRIGLVELATTTEATTGTDTTRAVTAAGVKAAITAATPAATASVKGLVELATNTEVQTGTDTTRAVTPAGLKSYFRGIEINSSADILNTAGNGNLSLYPSGQSDYMQAREGASQIGIARFSADDPGPSLVFYKSRGATIGTSKSVVTGDNIGMINFICDNGNIDYSGTTQGARVAYIHADVFESSTITSSGTTNVGIRGALRFYVCSDSSSRNGKGIEMLDNSMRPMDDNIIALGTSGRRYTNVYSVNGTIQTSDANQKTDIKPIDDRVLDAWGLVAFRQFRMKSDDKPIHVGVIAQEVDEAFKSYGLDARDYGLFCDDKDEDGETILGIRYNEALALECAYQRRALQQLTMRMGALERG